MTPDKLLRIFGVPKDLILPRPGRDGIAMFSTFDVKRYPNDAALVDKMKAMAIRGESILLCSPISGRGKSHLAAAYMGRAYYRDMHPVGDLRRVSEEVIKELKGSKETRRNRGAAPVAIALERVNPGVEYTLHPPDSYRWINLDSFRAEQLGITGTGIQSLENLERNLARILNGCQCLCLDELGREPPSATPRIMQIAREMLDRRRILIATSPLTGEAWDVYAANYGHVFRRWADNGERIELT